MVFNYQLKDSLGFVSCTGWEISITQILLIVIHIPKYRNLNGLNNY